MSTADIVRWTRKGLLGFSWNQLDTFERLIDPPQLRERLAHRAKGFAQGESDFHALELPWRFGIYFYGPSGSGKTAASRAMARLIEWQHFTIPSHEILDSHLLEHALHEAVSSSHRVVVLEDIDLIIRRMEPEVFFTLLDHTLDRSHGILWVATTRHAENAPKTQLIRPGRFDESIRLEIPHLEQRKEILMQLFENRMGTSLDTALLDEWTALSEGLNFSHFEELRQLIARLRLDRRELSEVHSLIRAHIEDQLIAGDRLGGLSDSTEELLQRVNQVDPRVLTAAMDLTDVIRTLMDKVIGDAAEATKEAHPGEDAN